VCEREGGGVKGIMISVTFGIQKSMVDKLFIRKFRKRGL